eukprot:c11251_g1_i1.p1 GENE.c11251_g1_i1~~c11251_g1_i1.p1  ORF type:complete len:314 (+),score=78.60 c11251_g1_i1:27-944(+)
MPDTEQQDQAQVAQTEEQVEFRPVKRSVAARQRKIEAEDDDVVIANLKKDKKRINSFSNKVLQKDDKDKGINFVQFDSERDLLADKADLHAVSANEIDTSTDRDARAVWERNKVLDKESAPAQGEVYRGKSAYSTGLKKSESYAMGATKGPLRASQSIRVTCRFDYQPDICKDYKQTGYCGYGDSCKFMHDRGDYKSGWQIEQEWDEEQKRKRNRIEGVEGDEEQGGEKESEDNLPFACFICREPFTIACNPVVTQCQHYFCEKCALAQFSKKSKCFVCNAQTHGIFNVAHKIIAKLAKLKPDDD